MSRHARRERGRLELWRRGQVVCRLAPGQRTMLGRAPAADVVLTHPSVSRLHARIIWPGDRAAPFIEDLDSQNGVALDGRRIAKSAELRDGVEVLLGALA